MNRRKMILIGITGATACITFILIAVVVTWKYNGNDIPDRARVEATVSPARENVNTVSRVNNPIITGNTKYISQIYYVNTDEQERLVEEQMNVPPEFIAMNKEQLQNYLDEYLEELPLNEYLDGLLDYEIIEFSNEKVILRKTYASDWKENEYYLCDVNGEIVVFYSDKKTVYEYTGIQTDQLDESEQIKIRIGYFVNDEEELYALLESYSS